MRFLNSVNPNVKTYLLANSFYYGGFDIINAFLSILITSQITDNKLEYVGYILGYYMLVRAGMELPLSKITRGLSDQNKINVVTYSFIFYGILIALMGFSTNIMQLLVLQTLIAMLDALAYPLKWTLFTKIIDNSNQELEWGLEDVLSVIVTAFTSILGGIISKVYGLSSVFILFGIMFSLCGITFHLIKIKKTKGPL